VELTLLESSDSAKKLIKPTIEPIHLNAIVVTNKKGEENFNYDWSLKYGPIVNKYTYGDNTVMDSRKRKRKGKEKEKDLLLFAISKVKVSSVWRKPEKIIDWMIASKPEMLCKNDIISLDTDFRVETSPHKYHTLEIVTKNAKVLFMILEKFKIQRESWSVLLTDLNVWKMMCYWLRTFNVLESIISYLF